MGVLQEFYCHECIGYFTVRLNMELNIDIELLCPNCGHAHYRTIKNGQILDANSNRVGKDTIIVPKSAYRKESITKEMKKQIRNGVVIKTSDDLKDDWQSSFREAWNEARREERWLEKMGNER